MITEFRTYVGQHKRNKWKTTQEFLIELNMVSVSAKIKANMIGITIKLTEMKYLPDNMNTIKLTEMRYVSVSVGRSKRNYQHRREYE